MSNLLFNCHDKKAILVMLRFNGLVHKFIMCKCEIYDLSVFTMRLGVGISGPVCSCIAPWICIMYGCNLARQGHLVVRYEHYRNQNKVYYSGDVLCCCQHLEVYSAACVCWTPIDW